ncbi:MAG TPA: FMN-binding protein, partial [Planctomycetaceae bacterium]|nr:FMN-binding protein [Planctomycetaceae bacterium]
RGLPAERIALVAGLVLSVAATVGAFDSRPPPVCDDRRRREAGRREAAKRAMHASALAGAAGLVAAALAGLLAVGAGESWSRARQGRIWGRLLPREEFRGAFTTAQAQYLFGQREGQFVVLSWGGVSEALPNTEHASEVIALSLAQHPQARRVLVVGPGSLSICLRLRRLPQIERIVWLHPDPEYPRALLNVLPHPFRDAAQGVAVPGQEVRQYLRETPERFDLVLLNLPDPTTLVLNRYWTREFFTLVKRTLATGGVLCARMTGAANFMGGELVYLGSSAVRTIESVFPHVVLKPGDESWLIASESDRLTAAPAELRDRFAAIRGAAQLYPPDGLMSLYVPDRIQFQMEKYRQSARRAGDAVLVNTDRRPKAMLFSLMLALRRTSLLSFARHVPVLLSVGVWIAACPIIVYVVLRLVYLIASQRSAQQPVTGGGASVFDAEVLILTTGLAGMALSVVLMFLYQSHFGSLYLYIGLLSSVFMLGSFLGGWTSRWLLGRHNDEPRPLLPLCLSAHLGGIAAVLVLPEGASPFAYAVLMAGSGVFVGVYFPIAALRLEKAGRSAAAAGASLEMFDHLGGAAGAVCSGWLLLPLLGTEPTLWWLGFLVAANLAPLAVKTRTVPVPTTGDGFDRTARPAGYTLAGIAISLLIASHIAQAAQADQAGLRLREAAQALTGSKDLRPREATLPDGRTMRYWVVGASSRTPPQTQVAAADKDETGEKGSVFSTGPLVKGVSGYGGPVVLAVSVDRNGTLQGVRVLRSQETPAYLEQLGEWLKSLTGQNVFKPRALEEVDTVSGATMTSEAILRTLRQAGPRFAAVALQRQTAVAKEAASPDGTHRNRLDIRFVVLVALLGVAILLRQVPKVWPRRLFLLVTLVVTGFQWNLQYSSQQVVALLSGNVPGDWLSASCFLIVGVPLAVLLFGNIYCGYLCPFGALQELVGDLRPPGWQTDPEKRWWRLGRSAKYLLLALLVVLFALTRSYRVLGADPLLMVFSSLRSPRMLAAAV